MKICSINPLLASSQLLYPRGTWSKVAGRQADRLPPPSAEVNNDGAITPLPYTSSWCGA
jgi:hypothetical protein